MKRHVFIFFIFCINYSFSFNSIFQENDESNMLKDILKFSYHNFSCVAFFKDDYEITDELYETVFQSGIPLIVNESQRYCNGYLLLAKNVLTLPSLINNLRKYYNDRLVCYLFDNINVSFFLESNSKLFGEAEVLVATRNESYILDSISRTFSSITINSTRPWKDYKPIYNFMGRQFKVGTFHLPIFVDFGSLDVNGKPQRIEGVELKAFAMIADLINITWCIIIPPTRTWGMKYPNGSWSSGGIYSGILSGEVDLVMATIFLTIEKYESFSMSVATNTITVRHLVRRPHLLNAGWNSMLKPLPLTVWIIILLELFLYSWSTSFITRLKLKMDEKFIFYEYSYFSKSIFHSVGILLMTAIPSSKNEQGPLRHLINSWIFTCFLVTTCFGSSLVSHLTTPDLEYRPETIEDLCKEGYYWGLSIKTNISLFLDSDNPWHKIWIERFITVQSEEHHKELLRNDKFVLWGKSVGKMGMIINEAYLQEEILSDWEVSSEEITSFYYSYVASPKSPLMVAVNRYMLYLVETGHMNKYIEDEFKKKSKKFLRDLLVKTKPRSVASVLALHNFLGLGYLCIAGIIMATFCFIIELSYFNYKRSTLHFN